MFEKILNLQVPENIEENVAFDLFNLRQVMKSESLMSFFMNNFKNVEYTSENILKMIKYCKYIGNNENIFDFICENIDTINHNGLIDSIIEAGLDFAEKLMICFKNRNKSSNNIIFSLVKQNPIFIDLISYLDDEYVEIRDAIDSLNNSSTTDGQVSIVSILKTVMDKSKERANKIKESEDVIAKLNQKIITINDELIELKKENSKLNQDVLNQNDELARLRRDNISLKDEIDKLKEENSSKLEKINSLTSENANNKDFIQKIGEFLPKIKKINNMDLDQSKFQDVYNLIKEASDQRDLATIFYFHNITHTIALPKILYNVSLTSAFRGDIQLTKDFIECGANKFDICNHGKSIIHLFAKNGNVDALKYFMQYGYDINLKDITGNTPLHLAVMNCNIDICEYLCNQPSIDVNIRNNSNETPLDIANRNGYETIKGFLIKARASNET